MSEEHTSGVNALKQADAAARRGDHAAADRWSKTAERMAAAAERLAKTAPPPATPENEETMREALRAKIARFVEDCKDTELWERDRDIHAQVVLHAKQTGAPMPPPLRPHPAGPEYWEIMGEEG